jgi:hypothetical protein
MRTKITLKVGFSIFVEFVLVSLFYGAVVFSGGLIIFLKHLGYEYSVETNQIIASCIVLLTALAYGYFRLRRYKEKEVWSLEGGILSRGSPVNLRVNLSNLA